jgi:hypothetical protein
MIFGEHPLQQWENHGGDFCVYNFPENQERGNISRIVLYWLANDSIDEREKMIVWEVMPEKPTAFAGFKFSVFVTPRGFSETKNWGTKLPAAGGYYLEVFGYPKSTKLMEQLPTAPEVLKWRDPMRGVSLNN